MKRSTSVLTLAALACALSFIPHLALADLIVNGDFEGSPWLTGWTGTSPYEQNTPTIAGSASARFSTARSGAITQSFAETWWPWWQLDFDIVSEDPGGDGDRSLSAAVQRRNAQGEIRPLISYRINGDGDLQVFDRGGLDWHTPDGLAKSIKFVGNVTTDPLLVHHVTIRGNFDQATPTYDITVINSDDEVFQATGLSSWNDLAVAPSQGDGLEGIFFSASNIKGNYLLDNVTLVPEPSSLLLLAMGGLLVLLRRRRRAA